MADHEAAVIEYLEDGDSIIRCPGRHEEDRFWTCRKDGTLDIDGLLVKCVACGRVITVDGVVLEGPR